MLTVSIRATGTDERPAVVDLVRAAFSHDGRDGHEEVDIVERTWALGAEAKAIDLVAAEGEAIVGHVLAAVGQAGTDDLLAVAPLSVAPRRQNRGVGTALMTELLARADAAGWPGVVLLGDPAYYGRFGFEPARTVGVVYEPVGADSPYFQIRRLAAHHPSIGGTFTYSWETAQA